LNLGGEINRQLRDRRCEAYSNAMRVLVDATGLYTYPDITVACEEPRFLDAKVDTLLNPTLIVEVISPSTESYDRGKKFGHYRQVESLQEYVLVSQDRVLIERFRRRGADWLLSVVDSIEDSLRLESIGVEIPLGIIYSKVKFPEEESATGLGRME
jgi:Uma2 family endonuclease